MVGEVPELWPGVRCESVGRGRGKPGSRQCSPLKMKRGVWEGGGKHQGVLGCRAVIRERSPEGPALPCDYSDLHLSLPQLELKERQTPERPAEEAG